MANFKHIKAMLPDGERTAVYTFYRIEYEDGTHPQLKVRPALESNKAWDRAEGKGVSAIAKRGLQGEEMVGAHRSMERELIPRHCIVDWNNVRDDQGEVVPYSVDDALRFVAALPKLFFDELRAFCKDLDNFGDDVDAPFDAEAVAGN